MLSIILLTEGLKRISPPVHDATSAESDEHDGGTTVSGTTANTSFETYKNLSVFLLAFTLLFIPNHIYIYISPFCCHRHGGLAVKASAS